MKKKQSVFISVSIIIVLLIAWQVYRHQNISIKPTLQAKPKYFLIGRGHIAPSLLNLVTLKWTAIYASQNTKCQYYKTPVAKRANMPSARQVTQHWITKSNTNGEYQIRIPLDRYLPGECQWGISGIYVKMNAAPERWFIAIFKPHAHNTKTAVANTYTCSYDQRHVLHRVISSGYNVFPSWVNLQKNYNFHLNIQSNIKLKIHKT